MIYDRTVLIRLSICLLLGLSTAGCQSSDGGSGGGDGAATPENLAARACTLEADCGGELDGRWEIHEICGDGTFTTDPPNEDTTMVEQKVTEAFGWVEFDKAPDNDESLGDGEYELDVTSNTRQVLDETFDPAMVEDAGYTPEEWCDEQATTYEEAMRQNRGVDSTWQCEVHSSTACRCTVETTLHVTETGGYGIQDNEVLLAGGVPRKGTFCAQDNSLRIQDSRLFRGVGLGKVVQDNPSGADAGSTDAGDGDTGPSGTTGSFAMTIDGQSRDMPKLDVLDQNGALTLNATSADMASVFGITLMDPTTGTSECDSFGLTTMSYSTDAGSTTYQAGGGAGGSCTVELTTAEDGHLAGTFEATLEATQGGAGTISATNGSFDVQY